MQITFDPENADDRQLVISVLRAIDQPIHDFEGTATGYINALDNPATGVEIPTLNDQAQAAFGGAVPFTPAQPGAVVGQPQTAHNTLPQAIGVPMPAPGSNVPAGAPAATFQQNAMPSGHAPTAMSGGVELDINGLPWDPRIHASTKEKNKDQSWRARRNLDKNLEAQVTAELRATMSASGGVATQQHIPQPQQQQQMASMAMLMGDAPQPQVTSAPATFEALAQEVLNLQTSNRITMQHIFDVCGEFGIDGFHLLKNRPDLFGAFWQRINAKANGQ